MKLPESPYFLFRFLKGFQKSALISILLSAAAVLLGVGLIGTSAYLISYAALQPSIAVLQVPIVGVRFFGIFKSVFRYLERLASHSVNFQMLSKLRGWIFRGLSAKFPDFGVERKKSDLLSRLMEDVETLEFFFIRVINPPLAGLSTGLIISLIFKGFHPRLAVTFLALFLLSLTVSFFLSIVLARQGNRGYMTARSELHSQISSYLEGLPDLIVNQSTSQMRAEIHRAEADYHRVEVRSALTSGLSNGLVTLLTYLSSLIMLYGGILLIQEGQLDPKLLAACALITISVFDAVQPMPLAAQQFVLSEQAGNRILELTGTEARVPPHLPLAMEEPADGISVRDLTFRYQNANTDALQHVSLVLQRGEKIALIGPSGAGKTTLARLLLGYWMDFDGQIYLGDKEYRKLSPAAIRAQVSYSGQGGYFFNTTLRQNLLLANPKAQENDIRQILHVCQLDEWFSRLPEGFDSSLGERGLKISEGERRRLDLARSLLRDCPVVILDEPFAGLDAMTETALSLASKEFLQARASLWITHRLVGLEEMDEILVMDHGRILDRGSQSDLLNRQSIFRKMWENQHLILADA